ncbi:MAG: hypothetical protein AB1591_02765 [Pseudomonadota bacterium]
MIDTKPNHEIMRRIDDTNEELFWVQITLKAARNELEEMRQQAAELKRMLAEINGVEVAGGGHEQGR